jgi:hypothetical protein
MIKIQPCKVQVKRLWPVFGAGDQEMNAQLVRLIVLYEDLRIEVCGSVHRTIGELDENGRKYRELYFLRRAFATVLEISGAVAVLEKSKAFEHEIGRFFSDADRAAWKDGVRFFRDNKKFLRDRRNLYGGHFHDRAALYGVQNLSTDHVDVIEIKFFDRRQVRVIFRFALEFVGLAFSADRGAQDFTTFIHESFEMISNAQQYATHAVQLIAKYYVLPRFGLTTYPQLSA